MLSNEAGGHGGANKSVLCVTGAGPGSSGHSSAGVQGLVVEGAAWSLLLQAWLVS